MPLPALESTLHKVTANHTQTQLRENVGLPGEQIHPGVSGYQPIAPFNVDMDDTQASTTTAHNTFVQPWLAMCGQLQQ